MYRETSLSFEVAILVICGMTLLITGILYLPASKGTLSYYENGFYGLLLIVCALQIIVLGKTPFGDMRRSKLLVAVGVIIASVGIVTCMIPIQNGLSRALLFISLGPGSFVLVLRMCFSGSKLRTWRAYGGIFWHLILGCSGVYLLSMLVALLIWKRGLLLTSTTATATFLLGVALFYLAWALQMIYHKFPMAEKTSDGNVALSTDQAVLMLMGVFMLILGVLLIPVSLGLLPFSGGAQLGLLLVIFAVQMLASGSTPIGPFPRSPLVIAIGFLFAALGIVSCIIPKILVPSLTVLVGVINILGGVSSLIKMYLPVARQTDKQQDCVTLVVAKLFPAQLTMNLLAIIFGILMLVPGVIHGMVIGVILAANGCVLLYLLHVLIVLDKMRGNFEYATSTEN